MKKWILALAMVLSVIPAARAAVPGHRNTNIVCENYYNIWVVTAERTGNPKYDGTVLRLDVKENKDSVLTVKYGTNFWGGWVREGDKLEFSGKWQGNKLSWNIVPGGSPNRYMLQDSEIHHRRAGSGRIINLAMQRAVKRVGTAAPGLTLITLIHRRLYPDRP
jgi:hypothetical protein